MVVFNPVKGHYPLLVVSFCPISARADIYHFCGSVVRGIVFTHLS